MERLEKKLGFGTMRLPLTNPDDPTSIDLEQFKKMADEFLAKGFIYFDTAYPYHGEKSEEAVREAVVRRHPRESFYLADKMPVYKIRSAEEYETTFAEQLARCGVDYFDFYLLHNMGKDRYPDTEKFGGFDFIRRKKEEGKIRHIGFSFHDDAATLDLILTDHPEVEFVQLQINYLDWESAVTQSRLCYETASRHGKKVIVMEPVKGGRLANLPDEAALAFDEFYRNPLETAAATAPVSSPESAGSAAPKAPVSSPESAAPALPTPASLAVRYAASLENVMVVLSGMSNEAQLLDNTSYMQDFKPLSAEETALTERIAGIINRATKVPCTSCRYCMEVCPKNINIPA